MTAGDRGSGERVFNLTHPANRACLIPGEDFFIIIGGIGLGSGVQYHGMQGYVDRWSETMLQELPELDKI